MTDLTIPLNVLSLTPRYKQAEQLINLYNPKNLVGHSLAGRIFNDIGETNKSLNVRTYGAPILSMPWSSSSNRQSHYGDPIALFDLGAHREGLMGNPHSYHGYK
jgi:hypothetical protein